MIKCIIFDLGDVLVHNNPIHACKRLAKHCPLTPNEVAWFAPPYVHKLLDTGKINNRDLYRLAVKNLGLKKIPQKRFETIFADIFTNNKPVQEIARKLSRNYRLLLLSNTNAIHFNHIKKKFPILRIFKHHIVSYKVCYTKPEKQIYRIALKKSRCKPEECIFIDNTKMNTTAATKLGMAGIHYTTNRKLKADLKKLGVKV